MVVSVSAMYSSSATSRRMQFRRAHTANMAADYITEEDNENEADDADEESKLIHKVDSPLLPRDNNIITQSPALSMRSSADGCSSSTSPVKSLPAANTMRAIQRRASFQKQRSHTVSSDSATTSGSFTSVTSNKSQEARDVHRPTISTSQLLTKMKDRIRQRVFNASEWPDAAALVQERYRQRALSAIEALNSRIERSNAECIPMQDLGADEDTTIEHSRHPLQRVDRARHSLPSPNTQWSLDSQQACAKYLKRRSVSEGQADHSRRMGRGVVCSNEDLRSIVWDYKKRKSVHLRAHSVDFSNHHYPRRRGDVISTQISSESTTSSNSYNTQTSVSIDREDPDGNCIPNQTIEIYPDAIFEPAETKEPLASPTHSDSDRNGNIVSEKLTNASTSADPTPDVISQESTGADHCAEFDPEILGTAIETYLDSIIQNNSTDNVNDSMNEQNVSSHTLSDEESVRNIDLDKDDAKDSAGFWTRLLCIFRNPDAAN